MLTELILALQETQQQEGLNLTEMADSLRVSTSYLSMVYHGKRRPGKKLLSAVVRYYPGLKEQVALFLLADITTGQDSLTDSGDGKEER